MAASYCELVDSLEREWRDALCAKDFGRLRLLIHPQFVMIGSKGTEPFELSREDWLEAVKKRQLIDIGLEIKDAVVLDRIMIGTVEARWRLSYLCSTIEDCVLLTDVWVYEDDRWQVIRRHSSPMPDRRPEAR